MASRPIFFGMLIHRHYRWMIIPDSSFREWWSMGRWETGDLFTVITGSIKLWRSVNRSVRSTLFASRLLLLSRIPIKKITDAITSDSLSRHFGTPKDIVSTAFAFTDETGRRNLPCASIWSSPFCWPWFFWNDNGKCWWTHWGYASVCHGCSKRELH